MKNIIYLLFISIIFVSCNKIEPINQETNIEKKELINEPIIAEKNNQTEDWEINLNDDLWIDLEEEDIITARFDMLAGIYQDHNTLMESMQYKQFVEYIHKVFKKYNNLWWKENEEKNNYIFNRLIPKIVLKNYIANWKISEKEAELIIQSIKRNDLNTIKDKKLLTQKFKIYFEENKFNPFIKKLNVKWKTKEEKLDLLFNEKDWAIYNILSNRYNWNKTWIWYKPSDMEADFMVYLNQKLADTFDIIWVSEKEVIDFAYKKYNVNSLETLASNIKTDFENIITKYNLEWKIPLDRYYRDDERNNIFIDRKTVNNYIATISESKNNKFISDLEQMRFKMYLLSYFGRNRKDLNEDQWLWSSRTRANFIDKTHWKWIQNLFRLGRYLPWEEVKIDLNKNILD